jgi:hypothetical protein
MKFPIAIFLLVAVSPIGWILGGFLLIDFILDFINR